MAECCKNVHLGRLDLLRTHHIAVFRDKIILEAQPPITDEQIAEVEARLTGSIPDGLLALWRVAFGGQLDYDLSVDLKGHRYAASFCELFFPGSDRYRDLWGWIENELELAQEATEGQDVAEPQRLDVLPFGGFEYLERVYVRVGPEGRGKVLLWARGLPPAWKMVLHEDTHDEVADDVGDLFDQLVLEGDLLAGDDLDASHGKEMVGAIDDVRTESPALAAKLEEFVRAAASDWRATVAAGPL